MSIQPKLKACNGKGKAIAYQGCGAEVFKRTYGLCQSCYARWLRSTPEGQEQVQKLTIKVTAPKIKKHKDVKNKLDAYPDIYKSENLAALRKSVHRIVHLIDKGTRCIDCERTESKQWDAGHYKSRGAYAALAFNLHNIFKQTGHCNGYSEGNKGAYIDGVAEMYGQEYADYVDNLHQIYPKSGITAVMLPDAKKEAAKIVRELERLDMVYPPQVRIKLRDEYNKRIGIYLKNPYISEKFQDNEHSTKSKK